MKQVGLITIYDEMNFGNRLQNYALYHFLEQEIKCKCVTLVSNPHIRGLGTVKAELLYQLSKTPLRKWISSDPGTQKYWQFFRFTRRYIPTKYYFGTYSIPTSENNKFDVFIAGSDQLWNPSFPGRFSSFMLHARDYFLEFAEDSKKACYAASIGCSVLDEEQQVFFRQRLQHFQHISVREHEGKEIIKGLLPEKDVTVHIDPTMLLTKETWSAIAKPPRNFSGDPYMLEYFLGIRNPQWNDFLCGIREQETLKQIDIMDSQNPDNFVIGPAEFLYAIQHAKIVCTDSFHAVVFSILFDKPFVVFPRGNMNSRLVTLLSRLDLMSRMSDQVTEDNLFYHDYTHVNKILQAERELAFTYLNHLINKGGIK